MHKQDFVHLRALIEEIGEKNQTIKALKEVISRSHDDYRNLNDLLSYEQGKILEVQHERDSYRRARDLARDSLESLRETLDALRSCGVYARIPV